MPGLSVYVMSFVRIQDWGLIILIHRNGVQISNGQLQLTKVRSGNFIQGTRSPGLGGLPLIPAGAVWGEYFYHIATADSVGDGGRPRARPSSPTRSEELDVCMHIWFQRRAPAIEELDTAPW